MKSLSRIMLLAACVPAFCACGSRPRNAPVPPPPLPPAEAAAEGEKAATLPKVPPGPPQVYRIKSGDLIEVDIIGEDDARKEVLVGPDGRISYNIATDLIAAGETFQSLREKIRGRLKDYYIDPHVIITGLKYSGNTVSILGQVRKPGLYEVSCDTKLLDVIAMSGGIATNIWGATREYQAPTDIADLKRAFLLRGEGFVDVDFEALFSKNPGLVAANNVPLLANDRIYIPSTTSLDNKVFVLGEVAFPKVVRYQKRISFLEAITEAGGPKGGAWDRMAYIVRGRLTDPKVYPLNLRAVEGGKIRDVELASGDIVFIPRTPLASFRNIASQLLPGIQTAEAVDLMILRNR